MPIMGDGRYDLLIGAVLGGIGGIVSGHASKLWNVAVRQLYPFITLREAYAIIVGEVIHRETKCLSILFEPRTYLNNYEEGEFNRKKEVRSTIGEGYWRKKWRGVNVLLWFDSTLDHGVREYTLWIRVPKWRYSYIKKEIEAILYDSLNKKPKGLQVYGVCHGGWILLGTRPFRKVSSIIHHDNAPEKILRLCKNWEGQEDYYTEKGYNYQLSFLIHGIKGTGKTSMAIALASELRRPLYVISGNANDDLATPLRTIESGAIVLFDDCEDLFPARTGKEKEKVATTTTSKLSLLDGAVPTHNIIRIFTTNYPERLDDAFRRPGRVDYEFEFNTQAFPETFLEK